MRVYFDNAATTKPSRAAIEAYTKALCEDFANPSSLHEPGQKAKEKLEEARAVFAAAIGAKANEIYFTSGGSESDNQAIISAARAGKRKGKNKIISTAIEHHAVLHTLNKLKQDGFEIVLLPVSSTGLVTAEQVAAAIDERTCLVDVMYANNEIGTVLPIAEIGAVCRARGVPLFTDAVQAVGHEKIDVQAQNIDYLSLSAHKFHGPKGVGALYVRKGMPLSSLIEGGAQERGRRAGTENLPGIISAAVAIEEATKNLEQNRARVLPLRDRLIAGLSEIPHSVLNGEKEKRLFSNVHFCFEGIEGESLLLMLSDQGIAASSGSACTSGSLDPSHVLLAIGRPHEIAHGSLRLTLDETATAEQVDYVIDKVKEIVGYLRNMSPVWRDLKEGKREFIIK